MSPLSPLSPPEKCPYVIVDGPRTKAKHSYFSDFPAAHFNKYINIIYICMYVCIYAYIYIYTCMYIYICIQYISLYCDILTFPWFIVKITIYRSCYTQKIPRRSRRTSRSWCALCGARLRHRTAGTLAFLRLRGSKAGIVQPRLWKYVKFAKVTDAAEIEKVFFFYIYI